MQLNNLHSTFSKYNKIVVTGPQRSGTHIAAKIIADITGLSYIDERAFNVDDPGMFYRALKGDKFVIQCPAMLHHCDVLSDNILVVMCDRNFSDIHESEKRLCWNVTEEAIERKKYDPAPSQSIAEIKYRFAIKNLSLKNSVWLEYESLKSHRFWTKKEDRRSLSILICTIDEREEKLKTLLDILLPQINHDNGVEILIEKDNRQMNIGEKRNKLLAQAEGEYVCFIDDDDTVPDDYVENILFAINEKPDCIGFKGEISSTNGVKREVVYSKDITKWELKDDVYQRSIHHLNPIKRKILANYKFPDKNNGEDYDLATWLKDKLGTEVFINQTMYFYEADYAI